MKTVPLKNTTVEELQAEASTVPDSEKTTPTTIVSSWKMRHNAASAPQLDANDGHLRVHRTGDFSHIAWHGSPQSTVSEPHMY
eukprot:1956041-Amphidinium_carterae.1